MTKDKTTNLLLIFDFLTGDSSVQYYDIATVIQFQNKSLFDVCSEIEDSMTSYLNSDYDEDLMYEDIVADVLNASDYVWSFPRNGIPAVDTYRIMYI